MSLVYKKILLKLSGEALMGSKEFGLDALTLKKVVEQIKQIHDLGAQIGIVVGGGNLFRGAHLKNTNIKRTTADQMGMMATAINALAIRDVIESLGMPASIMSAFSMDGLAIKFNANQARKKMQQGEVIIFSGGTGNPFFTTDTAAVLRGIEIESDVVLKATKVDGIYTEDPLKNPNATRFNKLSYDEVIKKQLQVMDLTAFILCRDHKMPIRVFDMLKDGVLKMIVEGKNAGTLVE